ncbi:MAG TPA: S8 family serine peptidase [Mycobacteriales bacterium]|nr:S8 family serine peptidase [Mycobacteriales bacterium]
MGILPASAAGGPFPDESSINQVVGAPAAWAAGANGSGVDVALIDTGVTPVQGLNGPNKLVYGPDLSFDSQNPNLTNVDGYGHGTAMAGIIAGNDGTPGGYSGVAPGARVVSVKVGSSTGAADVSQMVAAIDWVTQHAHDNGMNIRVMNLSLGTNSTQSYQLDPLAHAAEVAWRHGIVVVVSTGNDGTATNSVADPAIDPYVLAVGADDTQGTLATSDDTVASFSQRGTGSRHADLVAPGTYVYGLLSPNSLLAQQNPNAIFGGRFLRGSGTSQAAAITSGAVADLLSARPSLTPDQVKTILTSTTARISTNNPNFVGSGLLQLPAALAMPTPSWGTQSYYPSTGLGSLEAARGNSHVSLGGVALQGEQDIFGQPWGPWIAAAEETGSTWSGGVFNGSTWSGSTWSGSTWSGSTWSDGSWSGSTWSGSTWSGSTWSGSTWSGSTWSGSTWSGSTWSGSTWSGSTWSGSTWSGSTWSSCAFQGATWNGATWNGATWNGATWNGATWN